jgi:hypothetical protein
MHTLRIVFGLFLLLCASIHPLFAAEISHTVKADLVSLWGESSYEISFPEGTSRLEWPMDMRALGAAYVFDYHDLFEVDLSVVTNPWGKRSDFMKDYDWIDESFYSGRPPHEGVDVFSQSALDSRIFMVNADARLFFYSYNPVSLALLAGYNYSELDYRAYNTMQVGYGSWQDQSDMINGPTITYALEMTSIALGMSCRFDISEVLTMTMDASYLPYVQADDEDNHIRRSRVSFSECTGTGTELSLRTRFNLYKEWNLYTQCIRQHISTSGDQTQYWYGDDPATANFDDTGSAFSNIDADIDQETFQIALGIGCRF